MSNIAGLGPVGAALEGVQAGRDVSIVVYLGADASAAPRRIERDDTGGVAVEGAPPTESNPYVGLEAFTEADSGRFFGREAIVDRLWNAVRDLLSGNNDKPRILPILGPSGSGKSSVARAGLLPQLARRPIPEMHEPHVAIMRPRDAPLRELALILSRIDPSETHLSLKARDIEKVLRSPDPSDETNWNGLSTAAAAVAGEKSLIVLIDQFEETYTLTRDDEARRIFLATLVEAASAPGGRVSVIITMRSDFIGSTARDPDFNAVIAGQGVIVPTMTEEELREAIEAPAREAGRPLPRAVLDRLLDESRGRVGALPLLEFALQQIWNGMAEGEDAGEVLARIGGVGGALAREAQRILDGLGPEEKQIARRAFLAMVSLGEGTQDTRRRASLSEMTAAGENVDEVHKVLTAFSREGQRLISLSGGDEGVAAEVTHEALFEQWQTLQHWLDEGRDDLRFQRQINEAAEEWDAAGRPAGMLWRPPLLTRLEDHHARNIADMTERQLEFLAASRKELRRSKILSFGTAAIALIAVVAVVAAVLAVFGWKKASFGFNVALKASELSQARLIKSQADQAQTDAGLLKIMQELKKYDAYKGTMEEWEGEFRARADELNKTAGETLPACDSVGQFSVYEKQLVRVPLAQPPNKAMFTYLAVVPGSGVTDWAPAVLDVFFAESDAFVARRDLQRGSVKEMMASVASEDQWGLLMGLGTEHILTYANRNYRLRRTDLRMNDEGDMVMRFEVCQEADALSPSAG